MTYILIYKNQKIEQIMRFCTEAFAMFASFINDAKQTDRQRVIELALVVYVESLSSKLTTSALINGTSNVLIRVDMFSESYYTNKVGIPIDIHTTNGYNRFISPGE